MPGRLDLGDVVVSSQGRVLATASRFGVLWEWRSLFATPRRIEEIFVEGLRIESFDLPEDETEPFDLEAVFSAIEIGEFRITGGSAGDSIDDVELTLAGLGLTATLVDRRAEASVEIEDMRVRRLGRDLDLGRLRAFLGADPKGLAVRDFEIEGPAVSVKGQGETSFADSGGSNADLELGADLRIVLGWWDPNLVSGLDPIGRIDLEGTVGLDSELNAAASFDHRGGPFRVAGWDIQELGIVFRDGVPSVDLAHPSWGRVKASIPQDGIAEIEGRLDRAPVKDLLVFLSPKVDQVIAGPASLSGSLAARVPFPVVFSDLAVRADLQLEWAGGGALVVGEGTGLDWRVSKLDARLPGVSLIASGRLEAGQRVDARFEFSADPSAEFFDRARAWVPQLADVALGGGPLSAHGKLRGDLDQPLIDLEAVWQSPLVGETQLAGIDFALSGDLDRAQWELELDDGAGSKVTAHGSARPSEASVNGQWSIEAADIGGLMALMASDAEMAAAGGFSGSGDFAYGPSGPRLSGHLTGRDIVVEGWRVQSAVAEIESDPNRTLVKQIAIEMLDGRVEGSAKITTGGDAPSLEGRLRWSGLDLTAMPFSIPESAAGDLEGSMSIAGSLDDPEVDIELNWVAEAAEPIAAELRLTAAIRGGVCSVLSSQVITAAGPVLGEAEVPIGAFERLAWLWPQAPSGVLRAGLGGRGLRSGPLTRALGFGDFGLEAETDLRVDLEWDVGAGTDPRLILEAEGLRVIHKAGEMRAEGPLVVRLDGQRLQVDPFVLEGLSTRIEIEALYDPAVEKIDGRLRAQLAPMITRILPLPVPVQMDGPIMVSADLLAPPSLERWKDEAQGTIRIDHRGGSISMRDPPLQIKDLLLDATLAEGSLTIDDGRATVNRGTVELAGGWDPDSGQGIVAEVKGVTVFTEGVLTKWDGEFAIEPHRERLAHITGDLTLLAGLWDESVALTGAFLGEDAVELPADDPLHEISLDVTVRGRAGIRVDNNLGRFDAAWDVIRVGGTAAEPVLEGEVRIAPGGTIAIAGNRIDVRRGSLDFTGNPAIDPIVEIVPATEGVLFGSETAGGVDPTLMATKGLASGLSSALGFENETLQPAEIAVQIERDPSVQFMIGQRLTRNLALFFGANLTDVQDRTTMFQAWNFPGLKGLIFQGYQETIDSNLGFNVMQQFRWGGTKQDQAWATINRFRLEGEWPLSKRSLRKSTRLRRGQPYDPFLLFVAAVRMERLLAENGYQKARVRVTADGPAESPDMIFTLDQGERQVLVFSGDVPREPSNARRRRSTGRRHSKRGPLPTSRQWSAIIWWQKAFSLPG